MNEKNDYALVRRPPSAVEKAEAGTKRVLSSMVADALSLAAKEKTAVPSRKFRIGEYEWREPDYRQILLWAKALGLEPQEVIRELLTEPAKTSFVDGALLAVDWYFESLPFGWIDGLTMTSLAYWSVPKERASLAPRLPSLTSLSCDQLLLTALDLSAVPKLEWLWCSGNQLTELDLSSVPMLRIFWCDENALTGLDLSSVPLLTEFGCQGNQFIELDPSCLPLLTELWCTENQLTELDLSAVPLLTKLGCSKNQLIELDLSHVPLLESLYCKDNPIDKLDIRHLKHLRELTYDRTITRLIQRPDQHF